MKDWKEVELGTVLTFQRGYDLPSYARIEGNIPVVSSSGISDYHAESKAKGPGVITGRYGTLGAIHYVESDYWPHNTTLYVKDFKGNLPKFIYYLLKVTDLAGTNSAGAVPGINRNALHTIKVSLPPLPIQRRIAEILGRYDALIDNYQKQISALESMAQELYREWFVRGRCPYAQAGEDGGLPVGWEKVRFTSIVSILSGGTPKTDIEQYWNGDIYWFSPADVEQFCYVLTTGKKITELGLKNCNSKLYPINTVVITARGTVGKCVLLGRPMAINQSNYALVGKTVSQFFVYFKTLEMVELLKKEAIGAVFETITTSNFERVEVILPTSQVLELFDKIIEPIFQKIRNALMQIEILRQTRDALLPKLLSGQLPVRVAMEESINE